MTSISNLSLALMQFDRVQTQQSNLNTLAGQLSTGKKTKTFTGLGVDAINSKRSRASLTSVNTYIKNIENADQRIKYMLDVLKEFRSQAEDLNSALFGFPNEGVHQQGEIVTYDDPLTTTIEEATEVGMSSADLDSEFENLRNLSKQLYSYIKDLLNTKDVNENYVLGGAESKTKPLNDNSFLDTSMTQHITDWKNGTISTTNFIADIRDRTTTSGNTDAFTDTIIGYNTLLTAGNAGTLLARVSDQQSLDYTALANEEPFRDILVGLSLLQNDNLPPIADVYTENDAPYPAAPSVKGAPGVTIEDMRTNFFNLFKEVSSMVANALEDIDQVQYRLESTRARMNTIKERYVQEKNLLESTIANIEDVDMNEVAVKINTLSIQVEASYAVSARLYEITLVNFI